MADEEQGPEEQRQQDEQPQSIEQPQQARQPQQSGWPPAPGYVQPQPYGAQQIPVDVENNSGQGVEPPPPISGYKWSWGAFILSWLWCLNHGLVALGVILLIGDVLSYIPYVGLVVGLALLGVSIYLGINGHRLAWMRRRYEGGIGQYLAVETAWNNWGIGVFAACVACIPFIAIIAAILFPVFAQAREKARAQICMSNEKQIALGMLMYCQDYDDKFPAGNDLRPTPHVGAKTISADCAGWVSQIYPYIKSAKVFQCPDDTTAPFQTTVDNSSLVPGEAAGTSLVPISYAMNSNLGGEAETNLSAPDETIALFEVNGAWAAPTIVNDQGGPSGNGIPVESVDKRVDGTGVVRGTLTGGIDGTLNGSETDPLYVTGYMAGASFGAGGAEVPGYDPKRTDGPHSGGACYAFGDGHVRWLKAEDACAGANNSVGASDCGSNSGTATLIAPATGCATAHGGTFSIN